MRAPQVVLAVNGDRVAVSEHIDLSTNLADFIRTETRFKVRGCSAILLRHMSLCMLWQTAMLVVSAGHDNLMYTMLDEHAAHSCPRLTA